MVKFLKKILACILTPLFYISFGGLLVIFDPLQRIAYRLGGYKWHKAMVDFENLFLQGTQYVLLNSVQFKFETELPVGQPIIFCANHQSLYDIPAMIYFLRKYHAKFISKIELVKGIPSISYNLRTGGGANINRKDNKQALMEIMKLGKRMKENNWSAVIYPEGTRSKTGVLKTFHFGGVSALLKTVPNALVVPVVIQNSWRVVENGAFPMGIMNALRWTVLPPIDQTGLNSEQIVQQVENAIRERLGQTITN